MICPICKGTERIKCPRHKGQIKPCGPPKCPLCGGSGVVKCICTKTKNSKNERG